MAFGIKAVLVFVIAVVGLLWSLFTGNTEETKLFLFIVVGTILLNLMLGAGRTLVSRRRD